MSNPSEVRERLIRWRDRAELQHASGAVIHYGRHPDAEDAEKALLTEAIDALAASEQENVRLRERCEKAERETLRYNILGDRT